MRKSRQLAVLAASMALGGGVLWMALAGSPAAAQQQQLRQAVQPQQNGPPVIALLDVSYIFKKHVRFKAMMEEMKAEVQHAETQVKNKRAAISKLAEEMKTYHSGSPNYKALEQEIAKGNADLSVGIQLKKKEFLQREAKIYYTVYQEILQEVNSYAAANNVATVLRFNGDPVDVENPESVLGYINKPVIWYAKNLDITPVVLERLNRGGFNPNNAIPRGAAQRPGVRFK